MDSDGTCSLCRILSSAYTLEAMKVITKEVTVTTLMAGGTVFDNQTREGGLGVDEG